jgi:7,8-dihydropterin-6-yl-methyl-4-(beta-D-ribofuranosyl)aminobenzene 5'-phosphate synthase
MSSIEHMRRHVLQALAALPRCLLLGGLAAMISWVVNAPSARAEPSTAQITVLYDAFGKTSAMKKDWGFSAYIEYGGKRILFDTGNNAEIFAHNVAAKGVDLTNLDFAIVSHRHGDHTSGLNHLLKVNPAVTIYAPQENFGVFGAALPGTTSRLLRRCDISRGNRRRRFVSAARGLRAISLG